MRIIIPILISIISGEKELASSLARCNNCMVVLHAVDATAAATMSAKSGPRFSATRSMAPVVYLPILSFATELIVTGGLIVVVLNLKEILSIKSLIVWANSEKKKEL